MTKATKQHQPRLQSNLDFDQNDNGSYVSDLDLQTGYRRVTVVTEDDVEIDDYVKTRLWLARRLALLKFDRIWS